MSRRRLPRFALISPLVLMSLALAGSGASAQTATKPATQDALARMNESVDALTKKVWPSVVQILVTGYGAREVGCRAATPMSSSADSDRWDPDS